MIAHKFLGAGAEGVFSGFKWPTPLPGHPGPWVDVSGPLTPGSNGIHACRTWELMNWIDDELWLVELDGEIQETDGVLVACRVAYWVWLRRGTMRWRNYSRRPACLALVMSRPKRWAEPVA